MQLSLPEKLSLERTLIYLLIFAVVGTFAFIFYLFFAHFTRSVQVVYPSGKEALQVGQTYQIQWKSTGVDKVGIVLFNGKDPEWIAKDVPASLTRYEWKIYPGRAYGDNYWIAIFEYPWKKGNKIDYSKGPFAITYPELGGCDKIAIDGGQPYIASDYPDLRRVFITDGSYTGNLSGLDGADQKCQAEADQKGFKGMWHAFLGGDGDDNTATERLKQSSSRGLGGIYIEANPGVTLSRGATCNRLLGKDFDEFKNNFSNLLVVSQKKLSDDFFKQFSNIWLGRIDEKSKKTCTALTAVINDAYKSSQEKYSLTTTCQNWTNESRFVDGYPVASGQAKPSFPTCYTPTGAMTNAVMSAGLSSGILGEGNNKAFLPYYGKQCDTKQKLVCVEE
jgi:hypothetical protein